MNENFPRELRIAVSIARKVNLGNYESVDLFMAVSGVEPGATDAEILEALATGDRAFQLLKANMHAKVQRVRQQAKDGE